MAELEELIRRQIAAFLHTANKNTTINVVPHPEIATIPKMERDTSIKALGKPMVQAVPTLKVWGWEALNLQGDVLANGITLTDSGQIKDHYYRVH